MTEIHSTAIVDGGAGIGANVTIGPYCCVGPEVTLADGVRLISHVVVEGRTTVGPNTHIYPFASIGHRPQDLKYQTGHSNQSSKQRCNWEASHSSNEKHNRKIKDLG